MTYLLKVNKFMDKFNSIQYLLLFLLKYFLINYIYSIKFIIIYCHLVSSIHKIRM